MANHELDDIVEKLKSLGCAYHGPNKICADPELTILESLKFYWFSNDITSMAYSLLKHRLHKLIHVERLVSLAKAMYLPNDELVLLIVFSDKMVELGDRRFEIVRRKLIKRGLKMKSPPDSETGDYLIKKWGVDPHFKAFGARVRTLYEEPEKKFHNLKWLYEQNSWLRMRALIGANYRADIAYLKLSGKALNPYQAAKMAGCTKEPAYRIWSALNDLDLKSLAA